MRKDEIHLIQGDKIYTTTIIIGPEIKPTIKIEKKLLSQTLSTTPKTTTKIFNFSPYNFSNIQLSVLCHSIKSRGPGLEAYLILKMTLVILPKKSNQRDI